MEIPGELGNSTSETFWSTQKGRIGKARNDIERSCDKTWAILAPRNAHLAMRNARASSRIGGLDKYEAR
jgi:hypothetical protein